MGLPVAFCFEKRKDPSNDEQVDNTENEEEQDPDVDSPGETIDRAKKRKFEQLYKSLPKSIQDFSVKSHVKENISTTERQNQTTRQKGNKTNSEFKLKTSSFQKPGCIYGNQGCARQATRDDDAHQLVGCQEGLTSSGCGCSRAVVRAIFLPPHVVVHRRVGGGRIAGDCGTEVRFHSFDGASD